MEEDKNRGFDLERAMNSKVIAFLLPTEVLFDNFVLGFAKKHLTYKEIVAQGAGLNHSFLAKRGRNTAFNLKPDIFLRLLDDRRIVADTKYKFVYSSDGGLNIAQANMYQMLAYAVRLKVKEVHLLYSDTVLNDSLSDKYPKYLIEDRLADGELVGVSAHQLPVIALDVLEGEVQGSLQEMFVEQVAKLRSKLDMILNLEIKPLDGRVFGMSS